MQCPLWAVSSSCGCSRCLESRCALGRPIVGWPVEFCDCRSAVRQDNPRLLGGCVYVNVRRSSRGIVERSHPYEMNARAGLRVIAPHGHATVGTAPQNLTLAAGTRNRRLSWFAFQEFDLRRFDEGIDGESRSSLALAPLAMATMYKQRSSLEAVAYCAASATALHSVAADQS